MRHSAITFASQAAELMEKRQNWDLLFCSDMLNLAKFARPNFPKGQPQNSSRPIVSQPATNSVAAKARPWDG